MVVASVTYTPSLVEVAVVVGAAAGIPLIIMLLFRIFPVLSVHEIEEIEEARLARSLGGQAVPTGKLEEGTP
jgi:Ni/Fe-hydrogenase subunit HybB-like protein